MSGSPDIRKTVHDNELMCGLRAQFELMRMTGRKLTEEHQMRCAETLLSAGLSLIPSDELMDHQFVVSRGVYEAAKKIVAGG